METAHLELLLERWEIEAQQWRQAEGCADRDFRIRARAYASIYDRCARELNAQLGIIKSTP